MSVLRTENLTKELQVGDVRVQALRGVTLSVPRGEFMGVIGPSGSGKSTLLGLIGGLDSPTSGTVHIDGVDITKMDERALTRIRNEKIGFVFQAFNLINTLTAWENVALPIQFSRKRGGNPQKRAAELLDMLGLGDRVHHRPAQLSGGQQQRVAIARALANNPPLLLADEPTGNLDTSSTEIVLKAFRDVQKNMGITIVMVTHNMEIAAQLDRVITLVDGQIANDATQHYQEAVEKVRRRTGELPKVG
jgi:putative ABC transport system ATP-binding protein